MKNYYFIFLFIAFISCIQKHDSQLEINFTSKTGDTIRELKWFSLTSLPLDYSHHNKNNRSFENVRSIVPNKFVFKSLDIGNYIAVFQIEKNGATFTISIDSLKLNNGMNVITKEVNLGTVKMPSY